MNSSIRCLGWIIPVSFVLLNAGTVALAADKFIFDESLRYIIEITDKDIVPPLGEEETHGNDNIPTHDYRNSMRLVVEFRLSENKRQLAITCHQATSSVSENGKILTSSHFDKESYKGTRPAFIERANLDLTKDYDPNLPELKKDPAYLYLTYFSGAIPVFISLENRPHESIVHVDGLPIYCVNSFSVDKAALVFSIESNGQYKYKDNMERILRGFIIFSKKASFSLNDAKLIKCTYSYLEKKKDSSREITFELKPEPDKGE